VSPSQGSLVTPATISAALVSASAGDVLILADGSYSGFNVNANGTLEAPIVVRAENLGGAIIDGDNRNVIYNAVYQAFKPQRSSDGDVIYHNTIVKPGDAFNVITSDAFSRVTSRNNIFIGGLAGSFNGFSNGAGRVTDLQSADSTCDFNYDGFGSIGTGAFTGGIGPTNFTGLAQLQATTTESNAVQLDLSVFAEAISVPANPLATHMPPNLELASQGSAIDAGVALTGFNDGFTGNAPDLGAYELGQAVPVYGVGGNLGGDMPQVLLGDCNQNGVVDFGDISPFIAILSGI